MHSPTPPSVARSFNSPAARPIVTDEYHRTLGWVQPVQRNVVTAELAQTLIAQGMTKVRARWHFRTRELSLAQVVAEQGVLETR